MTDDLVKQLDQPFDKLTRRISAELRKTTTLLMSQTDLESNDRASLARELTDIQRILTHHTNLLEKIEKRLQLAEVLISQHGDGHEELGVRVTALEDNP